MKATESSSYFELVVVMKLAKYGHEVGRRPTTVLIAREFYWSPNTLISGSYVSTMLKVTIRIGIGNWSLLFSILSRLCNIARNARI